MDNHFEQGSCDITWKIDHIGFSNNTYNSPTFYLGNAQKTIWSLSTGSSCDFTAWFNLILKSNPSTTTVYYDTTIYCNGESTSKSTSFLTFREGISARSFAVFSLKKVPITKLIIKLYLRIIDDVSSLLNRLTFRTVEAVETRRVSYDIPLFKELLESLERHDMFFRVLPAGEKSNLFKLKICATEGQRKLKALKIDISESSKTKQFDLYCKISAEDTNGKLISSATKTQTFKTKEDNVCSLKLLFTEDSLKSFSSSNHKLILNCEFFTTEGEVFSWIEESTTISFQEDKSENICGKNLGTEKINLRDDFLCLYEEGKYTDAVISAQGRKFPVHRTILSARSPVFAAMFDTEMIEKETNLVEIVDVEANTLEQMIIFMYSNILRTEDYETVYKLYGIADKYQILALKDKCSKILKKLLDTQNVIDILILTDMHHDTELQKSVETFIRGHAKNVFKAKEWKALMEAKPSLGCTVMHKFCIEYLV